MKELNRTNRLTIATVLIIAVFIVGFLTLKTPAVVYTITPAQMISELSDKTGQVYPEDMAQVIADNDPSYAFVDIRNPYEYQKGHIKSAYNIPAIDLLDQESLEFFKKLLNDSVQVVVYGADQLEANGPWMLLRETGFPNVNILLGGYNYYTTGPLDKYEMPEIPAYQVEEPAYDFAGIIKEMGNNPDLHKAKSNSSQPEIIMPVKRTRKVEGGC
jgi:rhodanese-related sulfurtransferase